MRRAVAFFLYLTAAVFFTAAAMPAHTEIRQTQSAAPEQAQTLLSQVPVKSYVSLPASFQAIRIQETVPTSDVTEDNVNDVMYDTLLDSAQSLDVVQDGCMVVMDFTITQGGTFMTRESDYRYGVSQKASGDTIFHALDGIPNGSTVRAENVDFDGYEDCTVDMTINHIYAMPYPVTDEYVRQNTQYGSIQEMRQALIANGKGQLKEQARQETLASLIDESMKQTTFVTPPKSLVMQELSVLQKTNPTATYTDAEQSTYRLLFIKAMIDKYSLATDDEMEARLESEIDENTRNAMSDYEKEREKYLLFEDDVTNYIYKNVQIEQKDGAPLDLREQETEPDTEF